MKTLIIIIFFAGLSGASWGLHETISHHWGAFQTRFPNADAAYWNPAESWKAKYKNGDPAQGEKFPGASTVFVAVTDAKHLLGSLHRAATFLAGAMLLFFRARKRWHYMVLVVWCWLAFVAGFHFIYTLIF